jgi:hypothetical protein
MSAALKNLKSACAHTLADLKAPPAAVAAWEAAWDHAVANPSAGLPCPKCSLEGEAAKLAPRSSPRGHGLAQCQRCKTQFHFVEF